MKKMACLILSLCVSNLALATDSTTRNAIVQALAGEHRSEANRARDGARKPAEVLAFFGLRSDMTVVEISPGRGWYTEVLAPVLKERGRLIAATFSLNPRHGYQRRINGEYLSLLGNTPEVYQDVYLTTFDLPFELDIAPPASADMVLTFRNAHNWVSKGNGEGAHAQEAFAAIYRALKPGGVLGVVDHRWPDPTSEDPFAANGYISVERVVALAKAAGFVLEAQSDLLANPRDTHDHPRGVWTLPPSLALGDQDRAKYTAIGESDRFVLRLRKPR